MDSKKKLLETIRKELRPCEEAVKEAQTMLKTIKKALKGIQAEPVLGGSIAKGTFLKNDYDADIFVVFNKKYAGQDISALLEKALKTAKIKYEKVHGSRDYFQVKEKILYEIVPVLEVKKNEVPENVADMSPLHVEYFLKKAKNNKKIRDDIRLTKAFMKSAGVYGAESYIKGFSGHVVDLLILNYGSFEELTKAAAKWKKRTIIDIEKKSKHPLITLNASKIKGKLIVIDPVQPERNSAAALSDENFEKFVKHCKSFNKKPLKKYFEQKTVEQKILEIKKRNKTIHIIELIPIKGKKDVSGSKALKIKEYLEAQLKENDFFVKESEWEYTENKATIIIVPEKSSIDKTKNIKGPPSKMKRHAEAFKKKHKNAVEKDGFYSAVITRKFTDSKKFLENKLKDEYVKERCVTSKIF